MNKPLTSASVILAIALFACLLPMPYGYYTLIRFVAMVIMACIAYSFWQSDKKTLAVIAGSVAVLFQPFVKIALDKDMWNVVDVLVAVGLLIVCYKERKNSK